MSRSRVVDFEYYRFIGLLRRASDAGARIDSGSPAWPEYMKKHRINVVAAAAIAHQKFGRVVAVVIDEGRETDGLYFYSNDDAGCLRLVPA